MIPLSMRKWITIKPAIRITFIPAKMHKNQPAVTVSLISTMEYMKDINLIYAANGKQVIEKIECKSHISDLIRRTMNLEGMMKE